MSDRMSAVFLQIFTFGALATAGVCLSYGLIEGLLRGGSLNFTSEGMEILPPATDAEFARETLDRVGGEGIQLVITNDGRNCGYVASYEKVMEDSGDIWFNRPFPNGGCVHLNDLNTIYVSENLGDREMLEYVVIHEFAHTQQVFAGESMSEFECAADRFSHELGISEDLLYYPSVLEDCVI